MNKNKFPFSKYASEPFIWKLITVDNFEELPFHMKENGLDRLIITPVVDYKSNKKAWDFNYLPNMNEYKFIKGLRIFATKICDLNPIHICNNLEVLRLYNGDKTKIDFECFPKLTTFESWDRKGIKKIWETTNLKELSLGGLKRHHYSEGIALDTIEYLELINTPVTDLDMLRRCKKLKKLKLIGMSKLEDFNFLEELPQLKHLHIKANKLKDCSVLHNLENLESCYIESKIGKSTVNDFINMKHLKTIRLIGNDSLLQIADEVRKNIDK